jgi:hypothetical protein
MTLLLLLAVLVGLLFVANRLRGLHFVVTGRPGEVLYTAAFATGADGWTTYDDGRLSAGAVDGGLLVRVNQPSAAAFSVGRFRFGDVLVNATARAVEGPIDNGFGLMVALQTQDNNRLEDDAYLLFLISSDGYYSVRQRQNGVERELSTWIPSSAVATGLDAANALQVALANGEARFIVNEQPLPFCVPNQPDGASTYYLDTCVDGQMRDALPVNGVGAGQVGVVALSTASGGPGVGVRFEDVVVLAP